MDPFASLALFVRVADLRSFAAAAQVLGISASAVGKAVTRLEEKLSVRLFHRSTRILTLTGEGEQFVSRARRILAEMAAAEEELAQASALPKGRLRISLPLVSEPFVPALAAFQRAFPSVELDLEFTNRIVDVIEEGYDVVVRSGDAEDSRLSARPLGQFRFELVASPAYLDRCGTPGSPQDLDSHACIHFRYPHTGKLQPWPLRTEAGSNLALPVTIVCNALEARRRLALEGAGIAYLSEFAVRSDLHAGRLTPVLHDHLDADYTVFRLLWPSGKHVTPRLRAFIDHFTRNVPLASYLPARVD